MPPPGLQPAKVSASHACPFVGRLFPLTIQRAAPRRRVLAQWFERTRLKYHTEVIQPLWVEYQQQRKIDLDPLGEVQLSGLGKAAAARAQISTAPRPRRPNVFAWSPQLWQQHIRVDLSTYTLEAFEGDLRVLTTPVAVGRPDFPTVTGTFRVYAKTPIRDMKSTENGASWDTKGVPFVQYFYRDWAIHGTYWHTDWGTSRSHGCVNLPLEAAEWLFAWSAPTTTTGMTYGRGPTVEVVP